MRVAIYARVSTKDQSCDLQLRDLKSYCTARKLTLFREYIDAGESGAKDSRSQLNNLMADARKRKFDSIVVWRFDRFARSTKHLLLALEEFRSLGIQFISYQENIDTTSLLGQALFTIVSAVAQLERDLIRERVNAGIRHARACGKQLGSPAPDRKRRRTRPTSSGWSQPPRDLQEARDWLWDCASQTSRCGNPKSKEELMLIHNNDGEVIGELNTAITQEHTVINTNTVYKNGTPRRSEHFRSRQSGERPDD